MSQLKNKLTILRYLYQKMQNTRVRAPAEDSEQTQFKIQTKPLLSIL